MRYEGFTDRPPKQINLISLTKEVEGLKEEQQKPAIFLLIFMSCNYTKLNSKLMHTNLFGRIARQCFHAYEDIVGESILYLPEPVQYFGAIYRFFAAKGYISYRPSPARSWRIRVLQSLNNLNLIYQVGDKPENILKEKHMISYAWNGKSIPMDLGQKCITSTDSAIREGVQQVHQWNGYEICSVLGENIQKL